MIRAHGVRPDVMERANQRGLEVIDGTCTWVIQEHKELTRLVDEGYTIVLLGTPNHAEVVGMLGFAPDAIVVDEEEEWEPKVPRKKRMALICQSTQPPWKFEKLAAFMVGRSHELKIVNTVCPVTIRRQEDTVEAAREVDLMVVVGGRSSANTKELTRLVGIAGKPAIQIEGVAGPDRPVRVRRHARSSASPAARRRRSRTSATSPGASSRSPARPTSAAHADELAREALAGAATPAGRHDLAPDADDAAVRRGVGGRQPRSAARCPSSPSSGGPNVGKRRSSTGSSASRQAIVEDRARTTRDRMYGDAEWNGRRFVVVDTGGLEVDPDDPIELKVQEQARLAIARGRRDPVRRRRRRPA